MTQQAHGEPPREFIWYSLEEALRLLQVLNEARQAMLDSHFFAGAVVVGEEAQLLQHKLDAEGDAGDE